MTKSDIQAWERELQHAATMQKQRAAQDSKTQAIKDRITDRNAQTQLSEQLRKERVSEIFWRGVMRFITHMTIAIVVIFLLISL